VRRHFERVADFPRGLIPFADAVCRFNPVYGQGMSVAALEASLLGRVLARARTAADPLAEIKTGFLGEVQAIIEAPWEMSAIPDFLLPQTTGERPANFEMAIKFALALTKLAARDPEVHKLNAEVQGLLRPRNALFEPALLQRVMAVMAEA
jgi:2-polyprenyl-6-methoxyphenol hydroxylase-like FAD-dependent oxidoreductase